MTTTIDSMVEDTATKLLTDHSQPAHVEAAEAGEWQAGLWRAVEDAGLTTALDDGLEGLASAAAVARATGTRPTPVPLVETILARAVALAAGLKAPPGPLTIAPPRLAHITLTGGRLRGSIAGVPFAPWCSHVAICRDGQVALVPTKGMAWQEVRSYAGEPGDAASLDIALPAGTIARTTLDLDALGALLRSFQMAGGLRAAFDLTVTYANERVQFGRALGKFQAIQHLIAVMAENVAAADTAAAMALRDWGTPEARIMLACAKIRCGEAAGIVAATAHQVHGAIGFTREHRLHHITRRLWAWRDEFGHEGEWAAELGRAALARGADGVWPMITGA